MSEAIPYDELIIGDELGPYDVFVSSGDVKQYLDDWDDNNQLYFDRSQVDGVMIPPAYMAGLLCVRLLSTRFHTKATLITKTSHENICAVACDQTIRSYGKIEEKYVKRGIEYVVISCATSDESGQIFRKSRDHIALALARRSQEEEVS